MAKKKYLYMKGKVMKVIYPGSFDPVTNGHLDIIKRASSLFDEVVVAVLVNNDKKSLFTMEERIEMLKKLLYDYSNVTVDKFSGLLVDYAKEHKIDATIRGLRAISDYEIELQMAHLNNQLSHGKLETLFLTATPSVSFLSSSAVREIASFGGDITCFVDENVAQQTYKKFQGRK